MFGGGRPEVRLPRRWPRIVMTETCFVVDNNERRSVMLKQLSAGGARVQSSNPLKQHSRVQLAIDLGQGLRISLDTEVMYSQRDAQGLHFNSGLRFLNIGHEGVPEISRYIEEEQRRRQGSGQKWQG